MILMQAPLANLTLRGAPSGVVYTSDQNSIIRISNGSAADQTFLQSEGCAVLSTDSLTPGVIDFPVLLGSNNPPQGDLVICVNGLSTAQWTPALASDGAFTLTTNYANLFACGIRTWSVGKVGRTWSVTGTFSSNITSVCGPVIGFDIGNGGSCAAGAPFLTWRADGNFVVSSGAYSTISYPGAPSSTGYSISLISGTVPTIANGDTPTMTLQQLPNTTAGATQGLVTLTNGMHTAQLSISPLPPGRVVLGLMVNGVSPVSVQKVLGASWTDASIITNITNSNATTIISGASGIPAPNYASPMSYATPDANAMVPRIAPPGFPALPFMPLAVNGPGSVTLSGDPLTAYLAANPGIMTGPVAYASPTGGAPGTGVLGNPALPFSLDYALRTTPAGLIICLPGVYPQQRFVPSDAAFGTAKLVIAQTPGTCIMRVPGDDITTLTMTPTSGYTGMYQVTCPNTAGNASIQRVTRYDVLDRYGFPARFIACASVANLASTGTGFFFNHGTGVLYLMWGGLDLRTVQARLRAYWTDAAQNAQFILSGGCTAMLSGFIMDGISGRCYGGGPSSTARPNLWIDNCLSLFSTGYGMGDVGNDGPNITVTRSRVHASQYDSFNFSPVASANGAYTGPGLGIIANSYFTDAGDYFCYNPNATANAAAGLFYVNSGGNQGLSIHGGNVAAFGTVFSDAWGQQVADSNADTTSNLSWHVGNLFRRDGTNPNDTMTGLLIESATTGNPARTTWIDTCSSVNTPGTVAGTGGLSITNHGVGKIYNSPGMSPYYIETSTGGAAPTAYTPGSP